MPPTRWQGVSSSLGLGAVYHRTPDIAVRTPRKLLAVPTPDAPTGGASAEATANGGAPASDAPDPPLGAARWVTRRAIQTARETLIELRVHASSPAVMSPQGQAVRTNLLQKLHALVHHLPADSAPGTPIGPMNVGLFNCEKVTHPRPHTHGGMHGGTRATFSHLRSPPVDNLPPPALASVDNLLLPAMPRYLPSDNPTCQALLPSPLTVLPATWLPPARVQGRKLLAELLPLWPPVVVCATLHSFLTQLPECLGTQELPLANVPALASCLASLPRSLAPEQSASLLDVTTTHGAAALRGALERSDVTALLLGVLCCDGIAEACPASISAFYAALLPIAAQVEAPWALLNALLPVATKAHSALLQQARLPPLPRRLTLGHDLSCPAHPPTAPSPTARRLTRPSPTSSRVIRNSRPPRPNPVQAVSILTPEAVTPVCAEAFSAFSARLQQHVAALG